jgi:hypothetical protein
MNSTRRGSVQRPPPSLSDRNDRGVDGPGRVAGERRRRDWLSIAWTAIFLVYCMAVLPLLGWAIVQAF